MFGYDEYAWLLSTYIYQFAVSLGVVVAFTRWLQWERGQVEADAPMRLMVVGIVLFHASVFLQSTFFIGVRLFELDLSPAARYAVIVPLRFVMVAAGYMHLHAFLVLRHGRRCAARRWLAWGAIATLPFFALSLLLA